MWLHGVTPPSSPQPEHSALKTSVLIFCVIGHRFNRRSRSSFVYNSCSGCTNGKPSKGTYMLQSHWHPTISELSENVWKTHPGCWRDMWFCCWVATNNSIVIVVLFVGMWLREYCIVAIVKMPYSVCDGILWNEANLDNPLIGARRHGILWYWELLFCLRCIYKWDFALNPALYILFKLS